MRLSRKTWDNFKFFLRKIFATQKTQNKQKVTNKTKTSEY